VIDASSQLQMGCSCVSFTLKLCLDWLRRQVSQQAALEASWNVLSGLDWATLKATAAQKTSDPEVQFKLIHVLYVQLTNQTQQL